MEYGYTGQPLDANGLAYHRARYYDPSLGVWNSQDPLELMNRYGYVDGNPISMVDPSGYSSCHSQSSVQSQNYSVATISYPHIPTNNKNTSYDILQASYSVDNSCPSNLYNELKRIERDLYNASFTGDYFGEPPQDGRNHCQYLNDCLKPRIFDKITCHSQPYWERYMESGYHPFWSKVVELGDTFYDWLDNATAIELWNLLDQVKIYHQQYGEYLPESCRSSEGGTRCDDIIRSYYPVRWRCRWNLDRFNTTGTVITVSGEVLDKTRFAAIVPILDIANCGYSVASWLTSNSSETGTQVIEAASDCLGAIPFVGDILTIPSFIYDFLDVIECGWERAGENIQNPSGEINLVH